MPHFFSQCMGISTADFVELCPETWAVVHFDKVRQFMLHDVILQMSRQEYQV